MAAITRVVASLHSALENAPWLRLHRRSVVCRPAQPTRALGRVYAGTRAASGCLFGRLRRSYDRKLRAVLSAVWVIVFALACEGESPQRGGPHASHSNGTGLKIVPYAPAPQRH